MGDATKMPKEIEQRIRALPGNNTCCDCNNMNPQWASVTYGCLMCLECSGQHRSIGVHLTFVRSIAMDSWKPREVEAMEKSGGNQCLIDFFQSKGISKETNVATKYGTKQANYYKERLIRQLDGRREPPPDPGRYDPATGGSDAQGAEPLPGESASQYNERQARLRDAARERMREKFGGGGMSGMGSGGQMGSPQQEDDNFWGSIGGKLGGAVSGVTSFVKEKVIENEDLRAKVGGITRRATDSEVFASLQRNVTAQEGSVVRKGFGWAAGTAGAAASGASGMFDGGNCDNGHSLRIEQQSEIRCDGCKAIGTRYVCARGCGHAVCQKCFEKPNTHASSGGGGGAAAGYPGGGGKKSGGWDDDDWGSAAPDQQQDIARLQKELGMNLSVSGAPGAPAPMAASPFEKAPAPAAAPAAAKPPMANTSAAFEPKPKAKAKVGLAAEEDFFAEFGM